MDVSNRALAMFLIVAIVVSMSLFLFDFNQYQLARLKITGQATSNTTSTTTLTISQTGSLVFLTGNNSVAWGSGRVNTASNNQRCNLTTWNNGANYDAAYCLGFTNVSTNLTLENQGNVPLNITINASNNATGFLGGSNPIFQIVARNSSSRAGCLSGLNLSAQDFFTITGGNYSNVCLYLDYNDSKDRMDLIPNISFDYSTASGAKTSTIFAIGTY